MSCECVGVCNQRVARGAPYTPWVHRATSAVWSSSASVHPSALVGRCSTHGSRIGATRASLSSDHDTVVHDRRAEEAQVSTEHWGQRAIQDTNGGTERARGSSMHVRGSVYFILFALAPGTGLAQAAPVP